MCVKKHSWLSVELLSFITTPVHTYILYKGRLGSIKQSGIAHDTKLQ